MTSHLHNDLKRLREDILSMGGQVEQALARAGKALVERNAEAARKVIEDDTAIDRFELRIDDECLKILALHQPVAGDLRHITTSMKINNDLERIGDLAVNIAERAIDLVHRGPLDEPLGIEQMTNTTRWMLRGSLNALVQGDVALARAVCARDDEVDDLNRNHFVSLIARMHKFPHEVDACLDYLTASLHLERVADLATNIAEDVIFLVDAVDIRHHHALEG
jgi:phosphate transport system protein